MTQKPLCRACDPQQYISDQDVEEAVLAQLALEWDKVDQVEWDRRQALCLSCPFRMGPTCGKCGCYYQFRTALAYKTCPDKRW